MHKFVIFFLAMSYSIVSHSSAPTVDDYLDRATPEMYDQYIYGLEGCLLYTSPSPRDGLLSRMPSSA